MNIPYEMFLTIQLMHLTCRKYHIHNLLQANKDETCSEEQVTTVQRRRIIWQVQRHHWCRTFQPWRSNQEEREDQFKNNDVCDAVSIRERKFVVPSCSIWKHHGIQGNISSTRLLTKRRHRLQRDICSQWELKHIHDDLDEDLKLLLQGWRWKSIH